MSEKDKKKGEVSEINGVPIDEIASINGVPIEEIESFNGIPIKKVKISKKV